MPENVQKRKARPTRSSGKPGEDHELGLWTDYKLRPSTIDWIAIPIGRFKRPAAA